MPVESIQWADGFLLVYSILDRSSFEYVQRCKAYIAEVRGVNNIGSVPIVLLANKADMVHLRQVTHEEGNQSPPLFIGTAPPAGQPSPQGVVVIFYTEARTQTQAASCL